MAPRVRFSVTCTVVMQCTDLDRCRTVEQRLVQRGFHSRSSTLGRLECVRSLEREYSDGSVGQHLDAACRDVETAVQDCVGDWRAFVQVVGAHSAWATLRAGRPALRGLLTPGRGSS